MIFFFCLKCFYVDKQSKDYSTFKATIIYIMV